MNGAEPAAGFSLRPEPPGDGRTGQDGDEEARDDSGANVAHHSPDCTARMRIPLR